MKTAHQFRFSSSSPLFIGLFFVLLLFVGVGAIVINSSLAQPTQIESRAYGDSGSGSGGGSGGGGGNSGCPANTQPAATMPSYVCNMTVNPAHPCPDLYQCVVPSTSNNGDGTCKQLTCNMSVHPARECPTGYSCITTSLLDGANGICIHSPVCPSSSTYNISDLNKNGKADPDDYRIFLEDYLQHIQ